MLCHDLQYITRTLLEVVSGISTFYKVDLGGINTCFHLGFEQKCGIPSFLDIPVMANFPW